MANNLGVVIFHDEIVLFKRILVQIEELVAVDLSIVNQFPKNRILRLRDSILSFEPPVTDCVLEDFVCVHVLGVGVVKQVGNEIPDGIHIRRTILAARGQ